MKRKASEEREDPGALLVAAIKGRKPTAVVQDLFARGASVDARGPRGVTPLIAAAKLGDVDVLHLLLARGADVGVKDNLGRTALHAAARHSGDPRAVSALLEAGAEVDAEDKRGITPLAAAVIHGRVLNARQLLEAGSANFDNDWGGVSQSSIGQDKHCCGGLAMAYGDQIIPTAPDMFPGGLAFAFVFAQLRYRALLAGTPCTRHGTAPAPTAAEAVATAEGTATACEAGGTGACELPGEVVTDLVRRLHAATSHLPPHARCRALEGPRFFSEKAPKLLGYPALGSDTLSGAPTPHFRGWRGVVSLCAQENNLARPKINQAIHEEYELTMQQRLDVPWGDEDEEQVEQDGVAPDGPDCESSDEEVGDDDDLGQEFVERAKEARQALELAVAEPPLAALRLARATLLRRAAAAVAPEAATRALAAVAEAVAAAQGAGAGRRAELARYAAAKCVARWVELRRLAEPGGAADREGTEAAALLAKQRGAVRETLEDVARYQTNPGNAAFVAIVVQNLDSCQAWNTMPAEPPLVNGNNNALAVFLQLGTQLAGLGGGAPPPPMLFF